MEYFLVFLLGAALAVVAFFVARPQLFTKTNQDFSYFEIMLEEALEELETKQQEFLAEINQQRAALLELHERLLKDFKSADNRSPKVRAVLDLAEKGHNPPAIAKQLGMGTGEVELILELEKEWKTLAETD